MSCTRSLFQRTAAPSLSVAVGLLVLSLQARAQSGAAVPTSSASTTPPSADSLAAITHRGRLIWLYDFAAAAASDSVMARRPAPELIQGYVARQRGERWDVAFGRRSAAGDTFYVAYEARQRENDSDGFDVVSFTPARADTGYFARAIRSIALATADFGPQRRPYNTVVLERTDGLLWVYLMPAQLREGVYPLGADVRYLVASDGRVILAKRKLHTALLERSPGSPPPGAGKLQAGVHTAVLDDILEDTDVFHVLARRPQVPEYVLTNSFTYRVETNGQIRVTGRRGDALGADSVRR